MRGCCLTNLIVLGVTDPGSEPPVYLYNSGEVPITGGLDLDELIAGAYGTQSFSAADYAGLSGFLRTNVTGDSGAFITFGDATYIFWIALPQASAPNDWTWNGNPIVFTPVGVQIKKCYEAAFVVPDASIWYLNGLGSGAGSVNLNSLFLTYDQPGQQTAWNNVLNLFAGIGSSGTFGVSGNNITLTINDTYMSFDTAQSTDGGSFQDSPFAEVACP